MNKAKALQLHIELKATCPDLILTGSAARGKDADINNVDLIWVGKIFPMHLLPVGEMDTPPKVVDKNKLSFKLRGEQVFIHRTEKDKLGAMILHLTGPKEYSIYVRGVAKKKGYKLNQYGLFKGDKCIASKTEQDIFEKLGIKFSEPVERNKFSSIKI